MDETRHDAGPVYRLSVPESEIEPLDLCDRLIYPEGTVPSDRVEGVRCDAKAKFHVAIEPSMVAVCPPHALDILKGELPLGGAVTVYGIHELGEHCGYVGVFDNNTSSCHSVTAEDLLLPIGVEHGRYRVEAYDAHAVLIRNPDGSDPEYPPTCALSNTPDPDDRCGKEAVVHMLMRKPGMARDTAGTVTFCAMHGMIVMMTQEELVVDGHPINAFCHMPGAAWTDRGCEVLADAEVRRNPDN